MKDASWYAVRNITDKEAEISIYDEIGLFGVTAKEFSNSLKSIGNRRLTVRIHSPGGEIFEGNAVYNALRRYKGGVDVAIDGLAASMATVIAMAGEKRSMAENAMFMIHNPWTMTYGDSGDLRKEAALMDDLKESIISTYAGKTGISRDKLGDMMDEETWLTAQEAKEMGFVTEITEPLSMRNSFERFDISKFNKLPENFMAKPLSEKPEAKAVEIPVVEETQIAEEILAEKPAVAQLDAETSVFERQIEALTARIEELTKKHQEELKDLELKAASAKHAEAEAKLAKAYESLERLERSYGLTAAKVIAMTPAATAGQKSLIDIYNEMPDGEEKSLFYNEHRETLIKFANKPVKAA